MSASASPDIFLLLWMHKLHMFFSLFSQSGQNWTSLREAVCSTFVACNKWCSRGFHAIAIGNFLVMRILFQAELDNDCRYFSLTYRKFRNDPVCSTNFYLMTPSRLRQGSPPDKKTTSHKLATRYYQHDGWIEVLQPSNDTTLELSL